MTVEKKTSLKDCIGPFVLWQKVVMIFMQHVIYELAAFNEGRTGCIELNGRFLLITNWQSCQYNCTESQESVWTAWSARQHLLFRSMAITPPYTSTAALLNTHQLRPPERNLLLQNNFDFLLILLFFSNLIIAVFVRGCRCASRISEDLHLFLNSELRQSKRTFLWYNALR